MIDPRNNGCCRKCWEEANNKQARVVGDALWNPPGMPFIVCKICGNKRCPKATDHINECTKSNEFGQPGSIYGGLP
jgi:hypothetical protein